MLTFIDALNNTETRSLIEQVEEIVNTECHILIEIRTNLIAELAQLGYTYTL